MKKEIKKLVVTLASNICTKMAFSVTASACSLGTYQPEEPKCLREE